MHIFRSLKEKLMAGFPKPEDVTGRPVPLRPGAAPHGDHSGNERNIHSHEPGIYVDLISGEPLFASSDEYESKTRWLNFTKPIDPMNLREVHKTSHGMIRT